MYLLNIFQEVQILDSKKTKLKFLSKKFSWAIIYMILLAAFTIYVILDTFVITDVYTIVTPNSSSKNNSANIVKTDNTYTDDNISISITEYRRYDTVIYVADIRISSVDYLKTAFAKDSFGKNITEETSEISDRNNAILAINGDFYGTHTTGYVIRNGVLYRDVKRDDRIDLVIWENGAFQVVKEKNFSADELLENGALHVFSFGPELLKDNEISVSTDTIVDKEWASNPRTAIGIVDDLHYLFVVSDGRTDYSEGVSLYQLAEFMQTLGVKNAYNLDGGGSSTMYFNGKVINNPTTSGNSIKERSVSDIVYIGY